MTFVCSVTTERREFVLGLLALTVPIQEVSSFHTGLLYHTCDTEACTTEALLTLPVRSADASLPRL